MSIAIRCWSDRNFENDLVREDTTVQVVLEAADVVLASESELGDACSDAGVSDPTVALSLYEGEPEKWWKFEGEVEGPVASGD